MAVSDTSPNVDNYFIGKGICYFKLTGETAYRHLGNAPEVEYTATVESLEHFSSMEGVRVRDKNIITTQTAQVRIVLEEGTAKNWALALMAAPAVEVNVTSASMITTSGSKNLTGIAPTTGLVTGRRYQVEAAGIPLGDTMVYQGGGTAELEVAATVSGTITTSGTITAPIAMSVFSESQLQGAFAFKGTNAVGAKVAFEAFATVIKPNAANALISEELGNMELMIEVERDQYDNFAQFYWGIPDDWSFVA